MNRQGLYVLAATALIMGACTQQQQPETGLRDKATHSGTAILLRGDLGWRGSSIKRKIRRVSDAWSEDKGLRRFVPLRHKNFIAGLDGPDAIVTDQTTVTLTLNTAFIKYFRERGGKRRKGEIAIVMSFDAGTDNAESILIYSSQGQTLGSYLDFDDWPVIGPTKIDRESLLMRVVVIEFDQAENAQSQQFVRAVAQTGTALAPGLGFALRIAQPLANFLIGQNVDDVVVDTRFSLQRVSTGQVPHRNALLLGKYVLVMQEDRLTDPEKQVVAPRAVLPPVVSDMRLDLHSDRVYKAYNYMPALYSAGKLGGAKKASEDVLKECQNGRSGSKLAFFTYAGGYHEGHGPIDWPGFYDSGLPGTDPYLKLSNDYRRCLLEEWVNAEEAKKYRNENLGYAKEGYIGDFELYDSLDRVLRKAYAESLRHSAKADEGLTDKDIVDKFKDQSNFLPFEYPVVLYPEGYTLLAQYPLHTHIVFSIEKSVGGVGEKYNKRFASYLDFLQRELATARDDKRIDGLGKTLQGAVKQRRKFAVVQHKILALGDGKAPEKVCMLFNLLIPEDASGPAVLSDAELYAEMFNVTGQWWDSQTEVEAYLVNANVTITDEQENGKARKTCTPPSAPAG